MSGLGCTRQGLFIALLCVAGASEVRAQTVQWASELLGFSTEHSRRESSAAQVLGPPEVWPDFGSSALAWAPSRPDSRLDEFVRVGFSRPMAVQQIAVAESLNPGSIYRIWLYDEAGERHLVYENRDDVVVPFYRGSRLFTVLLDEPTPYRVSGLKLVLRTSRVQGMSQIDAIAISDSRDPIGSPSIRAIDDELFAEPAEHLGSLVNSPYPDLLPMIAPDDRTLYFARKLHPLNPGEEKRDAIWVSRRQEDGSWGQAQIMPDPLNNEHHNFVAWISPDGRRMLLPHDYRRRTYGQEFRVSMSTLMPSAWGLPEAFGWSLPEALEIPRLYNRNEYTALHMDPEGRVLLMALEREEGLGGLDLYVSLREPAGARWSEPISLGPVINTAGMEGSVFLAADGRSLYFASNGHPGYGGYDMFLSRRLDDSWTRWSEPLNLGPRINSPRDEYYYTLPASGEYAYFSSDLEGLGKADLFRIRLPRAARPDPVTLVRARVLDARTGEPLPAELAFRQEPIDVPHAGTADAGAQPGNTHASAQSDPLGASQAVWIATREGGPGLLQASAEGYFPLTLDVHAAEPDPALTTDAAPWPETLAEQPDASLPEPVQPDAVWDTAPAPYREQLLDLNLSPLQTGSLVRLEGVYFNANRATLLRESQASLDGVAAFLRSRPGLRIEVGGHTNGLPPEQFCRELSLARARAVREYLIGQGVSPDQLEAVGYGKQQPVADNNTLEGRAKNQRVELKILKLDE